MKKSLQLYGYYYYVGGLKLLAAKAYDRVFHTYKSPIVLQQALQDESDDKYVECLKKLYRIYNGSELNLEHPKMYTEKIQWAKLYGRSDLETRLCDKYLVRQWIKDKIGEKYLIPLLGVWESFNLIDFDSLPNQFVLKSNTGSGNNLIIRDKSNYDFEKVRTKCNSWNETNFAYKFLELQYKDINPVILAEQYMEADNGELQDYKFLCFDGQPYYCWIDVGRFTKHKRNVYDLEWKLQSWNQYTYGNAEEEIKMPENFDEMIEVAKKLSRGFPHVRVDLYNIHGKIYFGEMTFTNGSGFEPILPREYDLMLGNMWHLPIG